MNQTTLQSRWLSQVARTMTNRNCNHGAATRITAQAYPDFFTLIQASGRTRATVVFLNSKLAHGTTLKTKEDRSRLNQFINENLRAGLPANAALQKTYRDHPDLVSKSHVHITMPGQLGRRNQSQAQFANDGPATPPIDNKQILKLFFLPPGTPVATFLLCWEANGSKANPINYPNIFDALVNACTKSTGKQYADCIETCKEQYPDLWAACDALAKMPV